eukprot:2046539-Pyramimonas_sp.AAC.1
MGTESVPQGFKVYVRTTAFERAATRSQPSRAPAKTNFELNEQGEQMQNGFGNAKTKSVPCVLGIPFGRFVSMQLGRVWQ